MLSYRVYTLDAGGHVCGPPTVLECADDGQAIAEAKALSIGLRVEVWQGSRQVAVLPASDSTDPTLTQ
jgi:hypothetical protein